MVVHLVRSLVLSCDRCGLLDYEVHEVGSVEDCKGETEAGDWRIMTPGQVWVSDGTGVHLIHLFAVVDVHRLDRAFDNCPQVRLFLEKFRLGDDLQCGGSGLPYFHPVI